MSGCYSSWNWAYEIGDLVYWEYFPNIKFHVEDVVYKTNSSWIWSSKLDPAYCRDGRKNYHSPINHKYGRLINITKEREKKLKEIGI
jgi:hypothetical protein